MFTSLGFPLGFKRRNYSSLPGVLKKERMDRNLSIEETASLVGVEQVTVMKNEMGLFKVDGDYLLRFAEKIDVHPLEIIKKGEC